MNIPEIKAAPEDESIEKVDKNNKESVKLIQKLKNKDIFARMDG